jgi:hypothetical protein
MAKAGAKLKLNKDMIDKMCAVISGGNYAKVAFEMVGVSYTTYYRWVDLGRKDTEKGKESIFHEFYDALKKAEAAREASWVMAINNDPSWQSKAWMLERRYPDRWGQKNRLTADVNVNLNRFGQILGFMTDEEYEELMHE